MAKMHMSTVLRDRLGDEGTEGLLELLESAGAAWKDDVLNIAETRFERRLVEEMAAMRRELHESLAAFRQEIAREFANVHREIANVRVEVANARVDVLRWSFLFWVSQVAVVAGLMTLMLRAGGR